MNSKGGLFFAAKGVIGASLALQVALSTTVFAQGQQTQVQVQVQAQPPASAALLKRLAEAVDGVRTGDTVFVVAAEAFPFRVDTIVKSRAVAVSRARAAGPGYGVFGPYLTTRDANQPPKLLMICHNWDSSPCDSMFNFGVGPQWFVSEVDSITIFAYRGRERRGGAIRGGSLDAVFLTLAAWDKLYYPYLVRIYGSEFADRRRAQLLRPAGAGQGRGPR
jgi:hypothetical protein